MEEILELIKENKLAQLKEILIAENPVDIAEIFDEFPKEKSLLIFKLLPKDISAEVFSYLSTDFQKNIIENITDEEIKFIIDEMYLDDTVDLLEDMPANLVSKILKNVSPDNRKLINQLLKYEENSAGSVMNPEYISLKRNMKISDAIAYFKRNADHVENKSVFFVTDDKRKLEGYITLKDLVIYDDNKLVEEVMDDAVISVQTNEDQEEVAALFRKYDVNVMPVVDDETRLVGVITVDDVVDVIDQENTEDFHIMAAMNPSDEEYLKESVFSLAKHRIIWLLVLMISATLTGLVMRKYEDALQSVVILAIFIPMLMDTGGNAGSQAATLIIRGIALDEITGKDIFKVLWKELRVSLVVGTVLSFVNFLRVYFMDRVGFKVALVVSISMFATVILAKIIGGILPIIAKALKLDPAIMASPLITTIVDAAALVIYFNLAVNILSI